jgi:hypothetical protein
MSMWAHQARFYARTCPADKPDEVQTETTALALETLERLLISGEVQLLKRVPLEKMEPSRSTRRRKVEPPPR